MLAAATSQPKGPSKLLQLLHRPLRIVRELNQPHRTSSALHAPGHLRLHHGGLSAELRSARKAYKGKSTFRRSRAPTQLLVARHSPQSPARRIATPPSRLGSTAKCEEGLTSSRRKRRSRACILRLYPAKPHLVNEDEDHRIPHGTRPSLLKRIGDSRRLPHYQSAAAPASPLRHQRHTAAKYRPATLLTGMHQLLLLRNA